MLLANFDRKEHSQHRAVSLRQHGFLVVIMLLFCDDHTTIYLLLAVFLSKLAAWPCISRDGHTHASRSS